MSSLVDALKPLREPAASLEQVRLLRPVSRISFMLTDTNAFDMAARFAVGWLATKVGGALPPEALALNSFDTRGVEGYHPCHAIRLNDAHGSIWAARIDEPGSRPRAGEVWSTELFVERRSSRLVRFGAQLMARRPAGAEPLSLSRPRLIYDLLGKLSAEVDGEPISESVTRVTAGDVNNLIDLIYRFDRRLPIVAVSTDSHGGAQIDSSKLALRLAGAAHLVALDPRVSWELTRLIGKRMSTFNGAVRIYMPGVVEEEEDPYQHPLWLAPPSGRNPRLIDLLAERILPLGFRDGDGESRFWHLSQLRQATSAAEARRKIGTEADQLRSEIVALSDEIDELRGTLETAKALESIAAANEQAALHDVEQLKRENDRLRTALHRFENSNVEQDQAATKPIDRPLTDYDDLGDWADDVLGPHIIIHHKALKDCRQNGHPGMLEHIANTLLVIRDYWIPHRLEGGLERRDRAATALAALGVEDAACFARREKAKEKPEYSVRDGDVTRVLYDHFKYGNSRNNAEQFRMYYFWDEKRQRIVIGKMPSHLPNDMS